MKLHATNMPRWLQWYLLGTLAFIITLLPIHAFLSTWGGTEIGPLLIWKSWKEILLVPAVLVTLVWVIIRPAVMQELFDDKIVPLIVLYGLLVLGYIGFGIDANGLDAMFAGLAFDLRYFAMFVLAFLLFRFGTIDKKPFINYVALFLIGTGLVLSVVGILQVTVIPREFLTIFGYEKFTTIAPYLTIDEKSPDIIRAFATLRGPNDYGAFLVMTLAFALVCLSTYKRKIAVGSVMLLGIFVSHSRSAYLAAAVVIALWLITTIGVERVKQYWKYGVLAVMAVVAVASLSLVSPTVRLIVFHSSENDTHLTEGNLEAHGDAIVDTSERVAEKPLGCGTGCSGPASYYGPNAKISENYYLQIAEQYGVLGLGLWLAIFVVIMRRLYATSRNNPAALALFIAGIGLSVIGVLLHVWADDPLSMTWWVIAGAVLGMTAISRSIKRKSA
jgi:hypothetical protein